MEIVKHAPALAADSSVAVEAGPRTSSKANLYSVVLKLTLSGVLVAFCAYYAAGVLDKAQSHEETDDAYVTGHLHQVASRLNGTVEKVLVDDNQHVVKGQLLVTLDARDFRVKVTQALANLEQAKRRARAAESQITYQDTTAQGQDTDARGSIDDAVAAISRSEAQVREAQAGILAAQSGLAGKEAELERAQLDYTRADHLEREGAISTSQKDSAKRDYLVALDNRNSAQNLVAQSVEKLEQAKQTVITSKARLTKAQAQLQLAKASSVQTTVTAQQYETDLAAVSIAKALLQETELNLSYTHIVAPVTGRVGKKTVEEGQRIEPGQPLLTLVEDHPWIVANFKETQLKKMHVGQRVEIKIDSFPDHKFEGRVLSFAPASGASFAVLPSDNATGNFTKIVQRLPVKIEFTSDSLNGYEDRMAPGLSALTSVDLSEHPHRLAEAR